MVKTAAIIHYWGSKYEALGGCAARSFKKFNPEVDLYHVDSTNTHNFECWDEEGVVKAAKRLWLARELMEKRGYEKVIILGADTITCSRLDEFLDINGVDILATFDYSYPFLGKRFMTRPGQKHLNADVICFTSVKALGKVIETAKHYTEEEYGEQGALNEVFYTDAEVRGGWVEERPLSPLHYAEAGAWIKSSVCYNVGSKSTFYRDGRDEHGNRCYETTMVLPESDHKPWKPFVEKFHTKEGKLFTGDNRQIKVWHYCDGFGSIDDSSFVGLLNKWIFEWFNEETKEFFKEHCECGDFFEKEFTF